MCKLTLRPAVLAEVPAIRTVERAYYNLNAGSAADGLVRLINIATMRSKALAASWEKGTPTRSLRLHKPGHGCVAPERLLC